MQKRFLLSFAAAALLAIPSAAFAGTVTITADPNAPTNNFGTGGNTNAYAYTITTSDDGTSVIVALTTSTSTPYDFANLYFDSNAFSSPYLGSTIGFEVAGSTVNDAFIPGVNGSNVSAGPGVTSVETTNGATKTITVSIANSFFENPPADLDFAATPVNGYVSLHISQSFGYSAVGQSTDFSKPAELGLVQLHSPVPEPAGIDYMAISGLVALAGAGRRLYGRLRS
jgi:hypothetical protein